jgi:cytochrome c553
MKAKTLILLAVLTLSVQAVYAQKCTPYERPLRNNFNALLDRLQSGQAPEVNSVDAFLGQLPESMRRDYIFMAKSRSLQEGTVESPRVILKSPNSEVIVSFTPDPTLRGGRAVEIMVWNAEEATYRMTEVSFSQEPGAARVQHNPAKCLECHQNPPRPVWDPYRFWSGQVPFHEDTVPRGSVEAEWYANYMRQITTPGNPRWNRLIPTHQPQDFERQVGVTDQKLSAEQPVVAGNVFSPEDGNGANLSNQLLRQNACRVINEVRERPDFQQIRYALAGALKGCQNVSEFLPEAFQRNAEEYFEGQNIGVVNGQFNFNELARDTDFRLRDSTQDKQAAQRWFLRSEGLSEADVDREMRMRQNIGFGFQNFEMGASQRISALRYLMLPMGVDVNRWSMAIDPMSFGHGEVFSLYAEQPAIRGDVARTCEDLASRSREALASATPTPPAAGDYACDFNRVSTISMEVDGMAGLSEEILASRAQQHFSGCVACHSPANGSTPFNNVPFIPFRDMNALKTYLNERPGLDKRILNRITRQPNEPGMMPRGGESLEKEAIIEITNWFQAIRGN